MPKSALITQSNYIPWKGYFDAINLADELVLLDDVQFTRRDWRNRNRIKTPDGERWLTIPVAVKGKYLQKINETRVVDSRWQERHLATIRHCYSRAPFMSRYGDWLKSLYLESQSEFLSEINLRFIVAICEELGITTRIRTSSEFDLVDEPNERLLSICKQSRIERYFTGPAARAYLDVERFLANGIEVCWLDTTGYPEYPQVNGTFVHAVTILDLLLNTGPEARRFMKTFPESQLRQ
jgi:hypothetical protein